MQSAQGSGSSTIKVTSVPAGIIGYRVRGFQFNNDPITIINGVDDAGVGIVTVSLSTPTINDLVEGEKVSIAVASEGDRTLCCPPVDTSPPFTPTEDGLETTSNFPNLKIDSGDVKFDNLTVIKNITVENYTTSDVSSKYLDINTPSGNFKILCE